MYAFLLILGGVIAAAGIVLLAAGVPIQGHEFDPANITPGAVSVVGGLILIGLAFAVRVLARIEQALVARAASRPVRPDDVGLVGERPAAPARIPLPPRPAPDLAPQVAPAVAPSPAAVEEAAPERSREKFPTLVRVDGVTAEEEAAAAVLLPPGRADEEVREVSQAVVAKRAVGAAPAKTVTRFERGARPASRPDRSRSFDAFWPKRQRPGQETPPAPTPSVPAPPPPPAEPALAVVPEQTSEPAPERPAVGAAEAPAAVSVLKSGVVDGMAYTLYSDGSIEAELPQGTLRFGSITELRNHIEQSA